MTLRAGALTGLMNQPTAQVIDGSVRFDGNNQYLTRSFGSGNRKKWTWACWAKRYKHGVSNYGLFSYYPGSGNGGFLRFSDDDGGDTFRFYDTGNSLSIVSKEKFRDTGWYHIVIAVDTTQATNSDRVKRYVNGVRQVVNASNTWPDLNDDLDINQSGNHFIGRVQASAYGHVSLSNNYFIDGQQLGPGYFGFIDPLTNTWRPRKFRAVGTTINDGTVWSSLASVSSGSFQGSYPATNGFNGTLTSSDRANGDTNGSSIDLDFSGKNIIVKNDIAIWSGKSSMRYSINGGEYVSYSDATEKWKTILFSGRLLSLKIKHGSDSEQPGFSGLAVDGVTMLDSTTTNLDFGTNGFYLPMENADDFEIDKSGKGNNWTKTNFTGTSINPDVLKDSPSGAVSGGRAQTGITTTSSAPANYATWSIRAEQRSGGITISEGNLHTNCGGTRTTAMSEFPLTGKTYWEVVFNSGTYNYIGMTQNDGFNTTANDNSGIKYAGYKDYSYGWGQGDGNLYNASNIISSDPGTYTNGQAMGWAYDADNNILKIYKDGVLQHTENHIIDAQYYPAITHSNSATADANFGQKPFKYAPPQGYLPLNSASATPETVIPRPNQYVGVATYLGTTGDGTITSENIKFTPDFVWVKYRDGTEGHALYDSVRGATKRLRSNTNDQETTGANELKSFIPGGFTSGNNGHIYYNGYDFVSWMWKAGGDKGTFNVDDVSYASASDINMSASSLNSAVYNTSNRWSDDYGGSSLSSGYPITQAFDGNRTTTARVESTQTAMSVALTNITVTNKIEVRGELGYITPYVEVTVGGTTHQIGGDPDTLISGSAGTTSRIITGVSGALTNVKVGRVNSGRTYLSQIIVDDKILVDDNITPPNAPSIPTTGCSVGTRQGFSIIKYTGSGANGSIAHGLSQAPDFFFGRDLEDTGGSRDWIIYHKDVGGTHRLKFNDNNISESSVFFQDTIPSNKLIMVGTSNDINSTNDYILYCFHNVPGLQKFGKYSGNDDGDSKDGPVVPLGFRPALVAIKRLGTGNWIVYDNERDKINPLDGRLYWNTTSANVDNSGYNIDFLSNGFKITGGNNDNYNADSDYVYAAWAEAPEFNLYGAPSNARC